MFDEIRNSFPVIPRHLSRDKRELIDELPSDYRKFLCIHNVR
jgi:hypothetical protein